MTGICIDDDRAKVIAAGDADPSTDCEWRLAEVPLSARHASFEELLLQLAELDPDLELPRRRVPEPLAILLPTVDRVRASLLGTPTTLPASLFADLAGKDTRVSSERARADLGWEPLPFDKSLADTVQWIRDHHDDHVST